MILLQKLKQLGISIKNRAIVLKGTLKLNHPKTYKTLEQLNFKEHHVSKKSKLILSLAGAGILLTGVGLGIGLGIGLVPKLIKKIIEPTEFIPPTNAEIGNMIGANWKGHNNDGTADNKLTIGEFNTVTIDNVIYYTCSIVDAKNYKAKDLVIPDYVSDGEFNYLITKINDRAFDENESITGSVTLPNTIKTIGQRAFNRCENITSINLGNSIESIGARAFMGCIGLINDTEKNIEMLAFSGYKNLANDNGEIDNKINVDITNGIKLYYLKNGANYYCLGNCKNVVTDDGTENFDGVDLEIKAGTKIIATSAFRYIDATKISNLFIPDSVITIGSTIFNTLKNDDSSTLIHLNENSNLKYVNNLCVNDGSKYVFTTFGEEIIDEGEFFIHFPNLVVYDGFKQLVEIQCEYLSYDEDKKIWKHNVSEGEKECTLKYKKTKDGITIEDIEIDNGAGGTWIEVMPKTKYYFDETWKGKYNYRLDHEDIFRIDEEEEIYDSTCYVEFENKVTIDANFFPPNTKIIGAAALNVDIGLVKKTHLPKKIEKIEIPKTVEIIDKYAFEGFDGEVYFEQGSNLKLIKDFAFYYAKLKTFNVPDSVEEISSHAFAFCENLEKINFTANSKLKNIGHGTFYSCKKLTEFIVPHSVTHISSKVFFGCNSLFTANGNEENNKINIYDNIYYLKNGNTYYCIGHVDQDDKEIGNFNEEKKLKSWDDSSLTNERCIEIKDGTKIIAMSAFENDTKNNHLDKITIPKTVEKICNGAFKNSMAYLKELIFEGVDKLPNYGTEYGENSHDAMLVNADEFKDEEPSHTLILKNSKVDKARFLHYLKGNLGLGKNGKPWSINSIP